MFYWIEVSLFFLYFIPPIDSTGTNCPIRESEDNHQLWLSQSMNKLRLYDASNQLVDSIRSDGKTSI